MPYKDPIKARESQKEYYLRNREKICARVKENYIENAEQKREYGKKYFRLNMKEIREKQKIYNEKNSLKNIERVDIWSSIPENKEKIKLYKAKWQKNHKAQKNATTTRRRAVKLQAITIDSDMEKIKQFYLLASNMTIKTGIKYCVDHVKPLIKGGLHHQDNLQVITLSENSRKGAKYPFEVKEYFLPDMNSTVVA